jgi:PAS domain S-box-containing protein
MDDPELMRKIILPEDLDKWVKHRQSIVVLSDSQEIQFRIRKKNGEICWIEHACQPVQNDEGEPQGIRASNRDVTTRKLAEETLKKKDRMLEEAQTIARLGSWDWNILTNELAWSDEVYRIFGFAPHEFGATYEAFLERIHSDDRKDVKDAVNQALNDPSLKYNIVHRIIKLDGSERVVRERGNVIFDDNGKPSRMVGTVQDITDIRVMEAETQKLRMEISHMDRVGMMGVLGAGLGHELNQPLAAILSNAQAALRFLDNDQPDINEVKEALQDIVSDDKRAGEIVHSIRNIMDKSDLEQEKIHLNETVLEVIKMIKSEVIERNISLSENFQTDMPKFFGNRVQIQQVILNLIMNALDAVADNDAASRKVIISTRFKENDGIILNVSDSGPGIKTDQVEDVFDSFHTTKARGLGIGLSICRSIAEKHGGTIWAENLPEGGAAFFFKLPPGDVKDE